MVYLNTSCINNKPAIPGAFGGSMCICQKCKEERRIQKLRGVLIESATKLLTDKMSEFEDDYPDILPKRAIREIEHHNEKLRKIAIELRRVADAIQRQAHRCRH